MKVCLLLDNTNEDYASDLFLEFVDNCNEFMRWLWDLRVYTDHEESLGILVICSMALGGNLCVCIDDNLYGSMSSSGREIYGQPTEY